MDQNRNLHLPVNGRLTLFYVFSFLIAILMTAESICGLLFRNDVYPSRELVRAFMPNDVVMLLIGVPFLMVSILLALRGRLIGLLFWVGALFFILYNYIAYVYAMPLNWAFPGYLFLVVLSVYSLVGLVACIDASIVQQRLTGAVSEKVTGAVQIGFGLLFLLRVVGILVGALLRKVTPVQTELAVTISDLLITPAWIIGGMLLLKRKALGYVVGLGLLFQGGLLFVALIVFLLLQPFLTSAPFAIGDILVISAMSLICFVPFGLFLRGVIAKS